MDDERARHYFERLGFTSPTGVRDVQLAFAEFAMGVELPANLEVRVRVESGRLFDCFVEVRVSRVDAGEVVSHTQIFSPAEVVDRRRRRANVRR